MPRRVASRLLPFLFKPEQVQRILEITAQLPDNPRALHRKEVYSLIFRLMYGLGLRVGEIVRLCHKDVDQKRRLLVIRDTKFGKNRLVPFGLNRENTSKHIYSNGSNGTGNGNLTILFSHLLITGHSGQKQLARLSISYYQRSNLL